MDLNCHASLRALAARTLILAQRTNDRQTQTRLVEIANEFIELIIGLHLHRESMQQRTRVN
jgi:hypothetical protein